MAVDVLLGLQWGDEGKGKIVDYLAKDYDIVARFQGGPNAGHTLVINGVKYVLHTIPSGVLQERALNIIGNGVVIDPITFKMEADKLIKAGIDLQSKLLISRRAHLILPSHRLLDAASEASKGQSKIGSTLKGIGPAYMDKTGRNGLRIGDILLPDFKKQYEALKEKHRHLAQLYNGAFDVSEQETAWFEGIELLRSFNIVDSEYYINDQLVQGKRILAEGAQGSLLDIDFGTYPYVTSSNTITGSACIGLGIPPRAIREVIGIAKAYCTRVGSGPFPTELLDEMGEKIRKEGNEFGSTTGRPRRCGWIDLPSLKYSMMVNGVTQLVLTKADVLNTFEEVKACVAYDYEGQSSDRLPYDLCRTDIRPGYKVFKGWMQSLENSQSIDRLPAALTQYLEFLEKELNTPITMLSTGPGRDQLIPINRMSEVN